MAYFSLNTELYNMAKYVLSFIFVILNMALLAQDYSLKRLEDSPRHHEWMQVKYNGRTIHNFVVYPEKSGSTQAVIVIHENRGLTDWVRSFADQLAEAGYLAIAPDLLSGFSAEKSKTSDFANQDEARTALYELNPDQITADLNAVLDYIAKVPASNGVVSVVGFCWGGSQSFRFATNSSKIKSALVFYGTAPNDEESFRRINAPVYGFYGGNDQRINATIEATASFMKAAGKAYQYEIYPGAGHAYMRQGDNPAAAKENIDARNESFKRILKILGN